MMRFFNKHCLIVCVSLAIAVIAAPACFAHWADLAVAEVMVREAQVEVALTLPTGLLATADDDGDGQLSPAEVDAHQAQLQHTLGSRITLTDGRPQRGQLTRVAVLPTSALADPLSASDTTHSTLQLTYVWPRPLHQALTFHYGLFLEGVPNASCVVTVFEGGRVHSVVFTPDHRGWTLRLGQASWTDQAGSFIMLGVDHILTGYDHLLFLVALLLLGGGLWAVLKMVTAFTVAHTITLALAVLGVVALPAQLVESAIALSIVFVALEVFWRKGKPTPWQWAIAFAFGLIHGLGFAGILMEIEIPQTLLPLSLLSFNLGVELGQMAVVAAAFALLQAMRSLRWERALRHAVAAGVLLVGVYWFLERALALS